MDHVGSVIKRGRRNVIVGKNQNWRCVELPRLLLESKDASSRPHKIRIEPSNAGRENTIVDQFAPLLTRVLTTLATYPVTLTLHLLHLPVHTLHPKSRLALVVTLPFPPSSLDLDPTVSRQSRPARNLVLDLSRADTPVNSPVTPVLVHLVRLRSL